MDINVLSLDMNIVWTFVNLLILYVFFRIFLFKPVNKILEERQNLIEKDLKEAGESKEKAEALKQEYQKVLDNAEEEQIQIIKEAKERAQIAYNKKIEESREEAARIMEEANHTIELERQKSMEQAQSEIAGVALLAAQKVLQKSVDAEDNKKLIGDFLKEAGASK